MKRIFTNWVPLWTALFLAVVAAGFAVVLSRQSRALRLNGRTIEQLAVEYGSAGYTLARREEMSEFFNRTGDPAYRELSRILLLERPTAIGPVNRCLMMVKRFFRRGPDFDNRARHGAQQIFYDLGTNAAPAISYLAPAMKKRTTANRAGSVLAVVGEGATPILAEALTNHDPLIQMAGLSGMGLWGANPKSLMPLIKQAAGSTDEWVSIYALLIVSEHGTLSSNDFLTLKRHSTNSDSWLAARAAEMMTNASNATVHSPR